MYRLFLYYFLTADFWDADQLKRPCFASNLQIF